VKVLTSVMVSCTCIISKNIYLEENCASRYAYIVLVSDASLIVLSDL
jgi:hypothetical protein